MIPDWLLEQESVLVRRMLHHSPDTRPESGDILAIPWLEELVSRHSGDEDRKETIRNGSEANDITK